MRSPFARTKMELPSESMILAGQVTRRIGLTQELYRYSRIASSAGARWMKTGKRREALLSL